MCTHTVGFALLGTCTPRSQNPFRRRGDDTHRKLDVVSVDCLVALTAEYFVAARKQICCVAFFFSCVCVCVYTFLATDAARGSQIKGTTSRGMLDCVKASEERTYTKQQQKRKTLAHRTTKED